MPWDVKKRGKKWVVVKKDGKVVGTHDSEESAKRQQRLLYSIEGGGEKK